MRKRGPKPAHGLGSFNERFTLTVCVRSPRSVCDFVHSSRTGQHRRGFTILEMVLVLAVLLIAVGISWPAVQRSYESQQLRQSAELVQVRMMAARVHALDTGILYQFRYEPGGRRFLAVPCEQDPATAGSLAEGTATPKLAGMLPQSVQFDADIPSQQNLTHIADSDLVGLPDAGLYQGANWGPPILFHSDGTASAAAVRLIDKQKQSLRLIVRPLTGGVTISAEDAKATAGS